VAAGPDTAPGLSAAGHQGFARLLSARCLPMGAVCPASACSALQAVSVQVDNSSISQYQLCW
jgi:hypothetical protein